MKNKVSSKYRSKIQTIKTENGLRKIETVVLDKVPETSEEQWNLFYFLEQKKEKNKEFPLIEENISHTDDSGLTNRPKHDPNYLEKNKNFRKNRKSFINCFGCEIFYDE